MKHRKTRKLLAIMLTLALVITSIPSVFFDTASAASGPKDGQVEYVGGTNSTAAGSTYDIAVSKTIEAVDGKENYFDITLKTTTHRHHVDMSTDVIVVMDISNTMNADPVAGSGTKLDQAKAATNQFIKQFAEDTKLSEDRRVGVVTFNQNAQVAVPLQEANDTNDYLKNFEKQVKNITAPKEPVEIKFTNIEGGLQLANNILKNSGSRFKFVILLTDGFPTTYIQSDGNSTTKIYGYDTYMSHNSDYSSYKSGYVGKTGNVLKKPGYMANVALKKPCLYGVDYSDYGAQRAQAAAKSMKDSGMNIFSVGIGIGGMTIQNYLNTHAGKEFSTVDTNGMGSSYVIGSATNTDTYKVWLRDSIAGGSVLTDSGSRYAAGDSAAQLATAYSNILKTIEEAPETTMREFYTVDPMSDVADFIGFYDKNGNLASNPRKLTGESRQNAENTAKFGTHDGKMSTIYWDMLQSGYTMDGDNLVFALKYRVRLTNEATGFDWATAYEMNDKTTLNYSQKYTESGDDVPDGTGVMEYPIPETEGYKGTLKFKKVDGETNDALNGVEFTLQHYGESCSVCGGDAVIADIVKMTGSDGYAQFDNIPSGHEYVLIEKEPAEYAPVHNHIIIVSYGDTYVGTKAAENKLVDGKFIAGSEAFVVKNTKVEPVEIQLQATKTMDGAAPAAGQFEFAMNGTDPHGNEHHEIVKNAADGKVTFAPVIYDMPGTYEYTISEVTGTAQNTVYDSEEHTVKIVVSKTTDGTAYQGVVTVDGKDSVTYIGKDNIIETINIGSFANTSRTEGVAELTATKTYTGGTLKAGDFSFRLTQITEGAPMPENDKAENAINGKVSFGEIQFTEPGDYEYRISEVPGEDKSVVYDKTEYTAIVTVTAPADLTSDAALQTSVKYYNAETGQEVDQAAFVNKDRLVPAIKMEGLKTLNGKAAAKDAFTFVFQEVDNDGNAIGTPVEIKNGEDGKISFDAQLKKVVDDLISEINAPGNTTGAAVARNYKIYEKAGTEANINYDDTYYVLQVGAFVKEGADYYSLTAIMQKVDGGNVEGILHVEDSHNIQVAKGDGTLLVEFENTSTVQLPLSATKKLESETTEMKAGDYTFVLEGASGIMQKAKNDADGNIKFNPIKFGSGAVGTHKFVIYEVEGDNPGLFYDDSLYTVTVEITMDEYGNLSISDPEIVDEYDKTFAAIEFLNKDMDPTHLHLKATKSVNGAMPTVDQQFSFQLIDAATNSVIETIHNVHETVAFSAVELDKQGTYNYIVKEVIPAADEDPAKAGIQKDGFTYDQTEYTVNVVVTDENSDGILEKAVTVDGDPDPAAHNTVVAGGFDNTYETEPVSVVLDGSKVLTGRDMAAGEFEFILEAVTKDAPVPDSGNKVQNSASGEFEFGEIVFDKPGTYEYSVKEAIPADAVNGVKDGVEYDTTVYNAVVTVTDNGKGELIAETTVNGAAEKEIRFENEYKSAPTAIRITADKSLDGRILQGGEFQFRLIEVDFVGNEISGTEQIVVNGTPDGQNPGKVYFDSIQYENAGTHIYKVSEIIPADSDKLGGITYDDVVYTIKVNVTDNGKGDLVARVDGKEIYNYNVGVFANKYNTKDASVDLDVTKDFIGRDWFDTDKFTFTLTPAADTEQAVADGIVKMENNEVTITKETADKTAGFDNITFKKAGTYSFVIEEVKGDIAGVTYDPHKAEVTVTVTDNLDGTMTAVAAPTVAGSLTFVNTYVPENVTVSVDGTKVLTGRTLAADEFEFELAAVTADAPMPSAGAAVKNAADGSVDFGTITYSKAGTYEYRIVEKSGSLAGITYDSSVIGVTVNVTYDKATGLLSADVSYDGAADADGFIFTNEYNSKAASVTLDADKKVVASEGNAYDMKAGDFEFVVTPADSNPGGAQEPYKVSNSADGSVGLGTLNFTEAGEYTYTVKEVSGSIPGMSYDDAVYTITVKVTDDESEAQLKAAVSITENGKAAESVVFENKYDPAETSVVIDGMKVLDSKHKDLAEGDFSFELKDAEGNVIDTVENAAAGTFQFGALTYDKVGTYEYTVSEVNDGKAGFTYDDAVYTVTVKVTDEDGALKAAVTGGTAETIIFTNGYEPAAADLVISGDKVLQGRELNEGEFGFAVMDGDKEIASAVNSKDGSFTFGALNFTEAGTYNYAIVEKNTNVAGITYDQTVYGVTVKVVDENGALKVDSVEYLQNGNAVDAIEFSNTYKAAPTGIQLGAAKVLEGRDLTEGEFTFVLEDADGNKLTAVNTADGKVIFDEITYDAAGTYTYKMYEVAGDDKEITYDETVYNITVTVKDDLAGSLKAEIEGLADGAVFKNTYVPEEEPSDPFEPEQPTEPEEPTQPPTEPTKPMDETSDGGTQTGDDFNGGLYGFLALAALAAAGTAFRRRKAE